MDKQEYTERKNRLINNFNAEFHELQRECAFANAKAKVGDIIKNCWDPILVDEVQFWWVKEDKLPEVSYRGWQVDEQGNKTLPHYRRSISNSDYNFLIISSKNINMKEKEIKELYNFYCKSFENKSLIENYSFDSGPITEILFIEKIKNNDWFRNYWDSKLKNSKQK